MPNIWLMPATAFAFSGGGEGRCYHSVELFKFQGNVAYQSEAQRSYEELCSTLLYRSNVQCMVENLSD